MKHLLLLVCIFLTHNVFAEVPDEHYFKTFHNMEGFSKYRGNVDGKYKGNLVVHFEDGSAWKIHPDDQNTVEAWLPEDIIHPEYCGWSCRSHPLVLRNISLDESARAMFIAFPENALTVEQATSHFDHCYTTESEDYDGSITTTNHYVYEYIVTLSDNTLWNYFSEGSEELHIGDFAYISCQISGNRIPKYFIISAIENPYAIISVNSKLLTR